MTLGNNIGLDFAFTILTLSVVSYWLGTVVHRYLPAKWLTESTLTSVRWMTAPILLVGILSLTMMLFNARNAYNDRNDLIEKASASIIALDRSLGYYGPETNPTRKLLLEHAKFLANDRPAGILGAPNRLRTNPIMDSIYKLNPEPNDYIRRDLKQVIIQQFLDFQLARLNLATKTDVIVYKYSILLTMHWLCFLFFVMGATAPLNPVTIIYGILVALSTSSMFFMIGEFSHPLQGFITLSVRPLNTAVESLERFGPKETDNVRNDQVGVRPSGVMVGEGQNRSGSSAGLPPKRSTGEGIEKGGSR